MFLFGIYFCFSSLKADSSASNFHSQKSAKLYETDLFLKNVASKPEELPNWDQEHWTPISISGIHFKNGKPFASLEMCRLNFKEYYDSPHLSPMFKDLVLKSKCTGQNSKIEQLDVLVDKIRTENIRVLEPAGFVFHESRVGSTLVANMLASNPWNMVFSESDPPVNALTKCIGCSDDESILLFRDVITAMGVSPVHKHMFFKFQSISTTRMHIALQAFPTTPWAFIFRDSVQTMMSQMAPSKGTAGGPCLRSKNRPPKEVSDAITEYLPTHSAPNEAWCAAHLNMVCQRDALFESSSCEYNI
jgi:hypothetical protein